MCSSVGRASVSEAEGHKFDPCHAHQKSLTNSQNHGIISSIPIKKVLCYMNICLKKSLLLFLCIGSSFAMSSKSEKILTPEEQCLKVCKPDEWVDFLHDNMSFSYDKANQLAPNACLVACKDSCFNDRMIRKDTTSEAALTCRYILRKRFN